jgi:predicted ATPase
MAIGAHMVAALGDLQAGDRVVMVVIDDLHWSDRLSAQALLFALRRMQADRVLALVSARPGELSRLGEGWTRFAGGDHRVTRLRLAGLSAGELAAWPASSASATCPAGPWASCSITPRATRCTAGPCSKSSAPTA